MTDKTITEDCERLFPIYDGMSEAQRKQTEHMRSGGAAMGKLKNTRFEDVKSAILDSLDRSSEMLEGAVSKYELYLDADDLKKTVGSVLEKIGDTMGRLSSETLGTTVPDRLPF